MSCIPKPTMPTSCSSELFVACPTMINVCDWLMMHRTRTANPDQCGGKTYDIFAVTEYPVFGSKHEHISTNVGIPLGPLCVEVATEIDVRTGCTVMHRDQVTLSVKYPLLPSVKAGTYKGDLHSRCGITMSVGVPEIYGTIHVWIQDDCGCELQAWLWVEFDFCVFDVNYKGKFAVLPIPRWFISSNKLSNYAVQTTSLMAISGELEVPSDGTNETIDSVVSDTTPGTALTSGPGEPNVPSVSTGDEANKTAA
ncbi:hypothetical protein V8D89_001957 [Ganoderma adspersum]